MPPMSMPGWASSLPTRIWPSTFSELLLQALPAQAATAGNRLQCRKGVAPALVPSAADFTGTLKFPRPPRPPGLRGRAPAMQRRHNMSTIQRFDPFNELDDLFKGFLVRPVAYEGRGETVPRMKVDVAEKNGAYVVNAEVPGVKKEDIHVTIDGSQVTLEAEAKREKQASQDERVLHAERVYSKVTRSFT